MDILRRRMLQGAGLSFAAAPLVLGSSVSAATSGQGRAAVETDTAAVTRERLDDLAASLYAAFDADRVLAPLDLALHGARSDVALSRFVTRTILPGTGEDVEVTGLLAVPLSARRTPLPVVSWQHGTILSYDQVPSNLVRLGDPGYRFADASDSAETLFNIHRFASRGYAVIAADYIGKGPLRGTRREAYAAKEPTVATCVDVLQAGLALLRSKSLEPGDLFLNGWSQGALNTQWLAQELQRQGVAVTGAAVQSPFNDLNEALRFWADEQGFPPPTADAYPDKPAWIALCMIILLGSYQEAYGLDGLIEAAVRPRFHDFARRYWDSYEIDPAALDGTFPSAREFFVEGLFDGYTAEVVSRFLRLLASNRATYWEYASPIRFYYGLADEAIHPVMARRPLAAAGPLAIGVPVPKASHRATFLASLYGRAEETASLGNVPDWFASLRSP